MTVKSELVWLKDDSKEVVTDSLHVAEVFGKKHKHILDAVSLLKNGVAEFSADPQSSLFAEGFYTHPQNKQEYPKYYMNKDGFTLLVMEKPRKN